MPFTFCDQTYEVLLLDFDQTLVDTRQIGPRILFELAEDVLPSHCHTEESLRSVFDNGPEIERAFRADFATASEKDPNEFENKFWARYVDRLASVHLLSGAEELFVWMAKSRIRSGLVTGASIAEVNAVLGSRQRLFDKIITRDDGYLHKPDPASYVAVAGIMGVAPSKCLAVEDSASGVSSAKQAGCSVVQVEAAAISNSLEPVRHLADQVVEDLRELLTMFRPVATART